jgi:beta-glucanase (GH16 family)
MHYNFNNLCILFFAYFQKKAFAQTICKPITIDFSSKTTDFKNYLNVDYNSENVVYKNGVVSLQLTKNRGGTRISLKDQLRYGKVDVKMKIAGGSNVVSSFILLAKNGDEIDFEFVQNSTELTLPKNVGDDRGTLPKNVGDDRGTDVIQTNFFYRGVPIYDINAKMYRATNPLSGKFHTYTIKWDPEYYEWYFDNRLLRRLYKNTTKNYPDTISNVQFGIWEAPPSSWAGDGIKWNESPFNFDISSINIECGASRPHTTGTYSTLPTSVNDGRGTTVLPSNYPTTVLPSNYPTRTTTLPSNYPTTTHNSVCDHNTDTHNTDKTDKSSSSSSVFKTNLNNIIRYIGIINVLFVIFI